MADLYEEQTERMGPGTVWCIDTISPTHICKDKYKFKQLNPVTIAGIKLPNGHFLRVEGRGTITIRVCLGNRGADVTLDDVLYAPETKTNLFSIRKFTKKRYIAVFKERLVEISKESGEIAMIGFRQGEYYFIRDILAYCDKTFWDFSAMDWHKRLGHLDLKEMQLVANQGCLKYRKSLEVLECSICLQVKLSVTPSPRKSLTEFVCSRFLEVVTAEVSGPVQKMSLGGSQYFVTFTDEFSNWTEVFFIKNKFGVLKAFETYKTQMEKQLQYKILNFRCENDPGFLNSAFEDFLKDHDILLSAFTFNSQQKRGFQRKNRRLVEMATRLLLDSQMEKVFWADAIHTATFVMNRCPSQSPYGETPFEKLYGRPPCFNALVAFGSFGHSFDKIDYTRVRRPVKNEVCIFIGYPNDNVGYKVYFPLSLTIKTMTNVSFSSSMYFKRRDIYANENFEKFWNYTLPKLKIVVRPVKRELEEVSLIYKFFQLIFPINPRNLIPSQILEGWRGTARKEKEENLEKKRKIISRPVLFEYVEDEDISEPRV